MAPFTDVKIESSPFMHGGAVVTMRTDETMALAMAARLRELLATRRASPSYYVPDDDSSVSVEIDGVMVTAGHVDNELVGIRLDLDAGTDEPLDGTHVQVGLSLDAMLGVATIVREIIAR